MKYQSNTLEDEDLKISGTHNHIYTPNGND